MARKQQQQQQEEKPERITRAAAANQVVAAMGATSTLAELAQQCDELVQEHGGDTNIKAAQHHVKRALETAEALGLVKLQRPTDIMVTRVKGK
jgi:hypothetical protein